MSSLEARAFAASTGPEQEIQLLREDAGRGSISAKMRIGGLLTGLGPKRWREARAFWLDALDECEWLLGDHYEPRLTARGASSGTDQHLLETAAGAISGMLGELAIRLDREEEAIVHLERGVHYQHSESLLRLALLQKSRGRFDRAQFLLTSVLEDPASDAIYLLGDLFEAQGKQELAETYFRLAAAEGHPRAASRLSAGTPGGRPRQPELPETISYGHGWSVYTDHLVGGFVVKWGDAEIPDLEINSIVSGIEVPILATMHDIYEELENHQRTLADYRSRTFAVASASKSALIRDTTHTMYIDKGVDVGIVDRRTGEFETHRFGTVRKALEYLRLIAPLDVDPEY